MHKTFRKKLNHLFSSRIMVLTVLFAAMAFVLIQRLFDLQIIHGESYQTDFTLSIRKERSLESTRGQIYDCNGKLIAYNKLAYCVEFEDNGTYESTRQKNLVLNGILYRVARIIEAHGDSVYTNFRIRLNAVGEYEFTVSGWNLLRFKADVYGLMDTEDLTAEQREATAAEMMNELTGEKSFGLAEGIYTAEELEANGLPASYTKEELLQLTALRSAIAEISYQKYQGVTIAKDIKEETVAQLLENIDIFPGISVSESSLRYYNDAEYLSSIIGYTGTISAEELEELSQIDDNYNSQDIVGKVGLEQVMETTLQGTDGYEVLYVDNLGKTLEVSDRVEPQAGDDIYLTLDSELQKSIYQLLEQYIAGIVWKYLVDTEEFNTEWVNSVDDIRIPVYDVYFALFENNVLDVSHLNADDATDTERRVYQAFLTKSASVFQELRNELTSENPTAYRDLVNADGSQDKEMQAYMTYIVNNMLISGTAVLNEDAIDKTDKTYLAWEQDQSISLQEFLTYAIAQNWIDISKISVDLEYLDSQETYNALADYITEYLSNDLDFCKTVYRYMLVEHSLSSEDVCLLLFDQGILEMDTTEYNSLLNGSLSGYDFIKEKIYNLELKPSQLALYPCSGSVVVTDPNTGDVKALVSYPGYDSNRLANDMDSDYYTKLASDASSPFYNRATQEVTAPGSTYKIVAATAGVMEGVVGIDEGISCTGKFTEVDPEIKCWISPGAHGYEVLSTAIRDSCNYYFNTIGYRLALDANGEYNDDKGLKALEKYASMYGLDAKSGVEIPETAPRISDLGAAPSAMGQGTNAFSTAQLARYVSTIANGGTCYDLTLIDKITDSSGNILEQEDPQIHNRVDLPDSLWNAIHSGMLQMAQNNSVLKTLTGVTVAGKTGTAEESGERPNHALFIGYAPYENPEIAVAVRIANGYSSQNSAALAKDVISYYFNLQPESELITGYAVQTITNDQSRTD